jgi:hypothetical protein
MSNAWPLTAFLGLVWLAIASLNAYYHSAAFVRKHQREASSVPFIGGLFAIVAAFACPWSSPWKWGLLLLALLLDLGSLPYVALLVMAVAFPDWLKRFNKRREDRVRRIVAAPRTGQPVVKRSPRGSE